MDQPAPVSAAAGANRPGRRSGSALPSRGAHCRPRSRRPHARCRPSAGARRIRPRHPRPRGIARRLAISLARRRHRRSALRRAHLPAKSGVRAHRRPVAGARHWRDQRDLHRARRRPLAAAPDSRSWLAGCDRPRNRQRDKRCAARPVPQPAAPVRGDRPGGGGGQRWPQLLHGRACGAHPWRSSVARLLQRPRRPADARRGVLRRCPARRVGGRDGAVLQLLAAAIRRRSQRDRPHHPPQFRIRSPSLAYRRQAFPGSSAAPTSSFASPCCQTAASWRRCVSSPGIPRAGG